MTGIAAWSAHKRATDPEWAARYRASRAECERRRRQDPEYRARMNARAKDRYRGTPPETITAASANRQSRRLGAVGRLSRADVAQLWARQPVCLNCGRGRGLDHIVPLARGGSNTPDNIQNLCLVCNQVKHVSDRAPGQIERPPFDGDSEKCRRGHPRVTSMRTSPSGHRYCAPCHRISCGRVPGRNATRRNRMLSDAEVHEIRLMYGQGVPRKQIVALFGSSLSHVYRITQGFRSSEVAS